MLLAVIHAHCTQLDEQFRKGFQIYLTQSNAVGEHREQLIDQWNNIVEAQNKVLARLTEVREMIRVHHIAFMDMLSTTEQLSDVRQQILAANAAFYAANREEVARKGGN
jgi:hypothetical protein